MTALREEWELIAAAAARLRAEREKRGILRRWEEVGLLEDEGLLPEEIGEVLNLSPRMVRHHRQVSRSRRGLEREMSSREVLAEQMAKPYTDPKARAWIYRQLGVEEPR
jgi:hypothetical protein